MKESKHEAIFRILARANPDPRTELRHHSPFELLVAVILSAQATDISVNKVTEKLFTIANTPAKMLGLGERRLKQQIKTIGLFNTKARNILKTCQLLLERHSGQLPKNRTDLEALPGVGRKTANVILNTAFGQPTIAVDTHIFRVSNRTGLAPGKTPLEVEQKLLRTTPEKYLQGAHHWLILHGRYTCKARKPACPECAIVNHCAYKAKTTV
ncbi:MAG: endonuclease III [Pseudomonadota bacterium]|nr:endonuclease III [Pseudomonadota bacterium]